MEPGGTQAGTAVPPWQVALHDTEKPSTGHPPIRHPLFLDPQHVTRHGARVTTLLSERLPKTFGGYPVMSRVRHVTGIDIADPNCKWRGGNGSEDEGGANAACRSGARDVRTPIHLLGHMPPSGGDPNATPKGVSSEGDPNAASKGVSPDA